MGDSGGEAEDTLLQDLLEKGVEFSCLVRGPTGPRAGNGSETKQQFMTRPRREMNKQVVGRRAAE